MRSRTWVWSVLLAMSAYHLIVLPSIFVLGPVLANEELNGASSWAIIGSGLPTAGIAALEAVTGVAVTTFFTLWETALQERIPERAISRVSSYDFFASAGLMPIGLALAGPIAAGFGLHETLFAMTAVGVGLSLACLCVPAVRALERRDQLTPVAPSG